MEQINEADFTEAIGAVRLLAGTLTRPELARHVNLVANLALTAYQDMTDLEEPRNLADDVPTGPDVDVPADIAEDVPASAFPVDPAQYEQWEGDVAAALAAVYARVFAGPPALGLESEGQFAELVARVGDEDAWILVAGEVAAREERRAIDGKPDPVI